MRNANFVKSERGQMMLVFALVLTVLILFTGLALDAGLLYVTKAKLSTSVDAACLTGMKNLSLGQPTAKSLATDMFNANFGPNPPTPSVTFPVDASGNQQVNVTATTNVNTLFMRVLSQWASVPVAATAISTRGKLIMSIVLDRSGSMSSDGGEAALKSAVPSFVGNFSNALDEVAMISFSSNSTIDFGINYNFITPITTAIAAMTPVGGTFGTGIGTQPILNTTVGPPLSLADLQNNSVTVLPGQNVVKVVVYFTDGLMNAVQDNFHCGGTGNATLTLVNYGGCDATGSCGPAVHFLNPSGDPSISSNDWGNCNSGGDNCSSGLVYNSSGAICHDSGGNVVKKFVSQQNGSEYITMANVTAEAQYRAIQSAIAMRTESPIPTYIFTMGLGSGVSATTQAFLAQLANDPAYPLTYIKGQPQGEFFYISSCPSSTCTTQVKTAFQAIAAKVLLRLTQ